jgi:hypothetical protein
MRTVNIMYGCNEEAAEWNFPGKPKEKQAGLEEHSKIMVK